MKDLVIFGTGGFAREVHELVEDINEIRAEWNLLGFLDGNSERWGTEVHGLPVLGGPSWLKDHPEVHVVVAVGNTAVRQRLVHQMRGTGHQAFATLVHPRALVGRRVTIGTGSIICAGTVITTDIQIGQHVIINLNCTVGHDSRLDAFVTIAPGVNVSGNVYVAPGCDLGTNSTIIQGLSIGHWSILGAGAVVSKDVPPNVTAVGIPAKPIKERPDGWQLQ